jgi:hypothetical protein
MKTFFLLIIALVCLGRSQMTSYSQWRAFTGPTPATTSAAYAFGQPTIGCGFIMGHAGADSVTGTVPPSQSRSGGVTFESDTYSGLVNFTTTSSVPRALVGATFGMEFGALPAAVYKMCDLPAPPSVAAKAPPAKKAKMRIDAKLRSKVATNFSHHFGFSPLAAEDASGSGVVTGVFSEDPSQLAVGVQLFPYSNVRQANVKITFCATQTDFCDTCAAPVSHAVLSTDAPLVLPYGGAASAPTRNYCVYVSLSDLQGSPNIMGGVIFGLSTDVKAFL